MFMIYTLIGGWGQMSNTIFESGGKCRPLLIIRGQMSSYIIFHRGGGGGGKCTTLLSCEQLSACVTMYSVHVCISYL